VKSAPTLIRICVLVAMATCMANFPAAAQNEFFGPTFSDDSAFDLFNTPALPPPNLDDRRLSPAEVQEIENQQETLATEVGDTSGEMQLEDTASGGFEGILTGGEGFFYQFPVELTGSVRQGYDTNVFTTRNDPIASAFTNVSCGMAYDFGNRRLQLATEIGLGVTYYYNRPGPRVDYNGSLLLSLDYEVNRRLSFAFDNTTRYVPQPQLGQVGGNTRFSNEYIFQNTVFGLAYQIRPRLSSISTYTFTAWYYIDEQANQDQGRISQSLAQSFRFQLYPKTAASLIYRVNPVTYFEEDLDSFGQFLLVGVDHVFTPRFRFSAEAGAEYRQNQNPIDGESTFLGPFFESNLIYNYGERSSLAWSVRYGTEASGLNNVTQSQVFRTSLSVNHELTRRLILTLSATYQNRYNEQQNVIPEFTENIYSINLGTRFRINRQFSLEAGYSYTTLIAPDFQSQEYTRQIFFLGGRISI